MTRLTTESALLDAALESPEIAPFAMFAVDLPGGTDTLWSIKSNMALTKEEEATQDREEQQRVEEAHKSRVNEFIRRIGANEPLFSQDTETPLCEVCGHAKGREDCNACGGSPLPQFEGDPNDQDDTPHDEWDAFWDGDQPTQTGYVRRARI